MDFDNEKLDAIKKYRVIVMHHDGYSYNNIAQATDLYKGTISKLINKFNEHEMFSMMKESLIIARKS